MLHVSQHITTLSASLQSQRKREIARSAFYNTNTQLEDERR